MNIIFLGESIHGVSEFTQFKREWLRTNPHSNFLVVFEADHVGMLQSAEKHHSETDILRNFPKVHRTEEMRLLLKDIVDREIPYYGADVVTRNKAVNYSGRFASLRAEQERLEKHIYSQPDPFPLRDEYMCDIMASVATAHPGHTIAGMFHNMHIKKHGSRERDHLALPSVAEQLSVKHHIISRSVGLFATCGKAICNDLSGFEFAICDEDVIECLADGSQHCKNITDHSLMGDKAAYHHAFEKETIPVRIQYDECVVFPKVHPPTLLVESAEKCPQSAF